MPPPEQENPLTSSDGTKTEGINPGFAKFLLKLFLFFLQNQPGTVQTAAPGSQGPTAETVEADLVAALDAAPKVEPGKMGGPILDAGFMSAIRQFIEFAESHQDEALAIFQRISSKLPPWLNV